MIRLVEISIKQGEFSIDNISFEVSTGKYAVLMGKTGSGKTTILEVICGLRNPDSGKIYLGRSDISGTKPAERGIGYVPQDGALFPTMTVREHLAFALKLRKWPES
ncbi:MAG TPA: ATP-binding cassette domain-containing protein, partial [Verrucomicrobia bacterium]|nr:ATP-binding cassette domain-containing protein [Verrucomicrobiota bacterium]